MKTARGLFARLVAPEHLERSAALTVREKRRRPDIARFLLRRETRLRELEEHLRAGSWRHGAFTLLFVRDPKPRAIARASVEDRVVHTALCELLGPLVLRSATGDDFACRPGFGTHRALLRLLELARRHRFALHLDLAAYFPSLDPALVLELAARRVRDERFLAVLTEVLRAGAGLYDAAPIRRFARLAEDWPRRGIGLPIGASTNQLLAAHLVLQELDHLVKRAWKVPGYVRYVDDLFLFADRRGELRRWREGIGAWLERERGLRLKHPRARILSCCGHLDALGMRVTRAGLEPRRRAVLRLRAQVAREVRGDRAGRPVDPGAAIRARVAGMLFG